MQRHGVSSKCRRQVPESLAHATFRKSDILPMTPWSEADWSFFYSRIYHRTGLWFGDYTQEQLQRRIRQCVEDRYKMPTLRRFLAKSGRHDLELSRFVDRMLINVTQLYRDPEVWSDLTKYLRKAGLPSEELRVLSAGSSTGAEAYTILLSAISSRRWGADKIHVRGIDMDQMAVSEAGRGCYASYDTLKVPHDILADHFIEDSGIFEVNNSLRGRVSFEHGNLFTADLGRNDIVACRNVVIYLNARARESLVRRLVDSLEVGGLYICGSTENPLRDDKRLKHLDQGMYSSGKILTKVSE